MEDVGIDVDEGRFVEYVGCGRVVAVDNDVGGCTTLELLLLTLISFFESVDKYSFLSVCSDWILLKMIVGIGHNHSGRVFVFRCSW